MLPRKTGVLPPENGSRDAPLVVKNRQTGRRKTVPGNILQCNSHVWSNNSIVSGEFPAAAIDGALSTYWEPGTATDWHWLMVDLQGKVFRARGANLTWGKRPPQKYVLLFSNHSEDWDPACGGNCLRMEGRPVNISEPYDYERRDIVKPYNGNTTNQTFNTEI